MCHEVSRAKPIVASCSAIFTVKILGSGAIESLYLKQGSYISEDNELQKLSNTVTQFAHLS